MVACGSPSASDPASTARRPASRPASPTGEPDQLAAARVCADHLRVKWAALVRLARTLRVFCEHPALADFESDGLDGAMLRDAARDLTCAADWLDEDIAHLLAHADPGHAIVIAGEPYQVNPETGAIEPNSSERESAEPASRG